MTARELLTDPTRWCKGAGARDASGKGCSIHSEDAVSFCLVGALVKIYGVDEAYMKVGVKLLPYIQHRRMSDFNDDPDTSHADVLRALELAGV